MCYRNSSKCIVQQRVLSNLELDLRKHCLKSSISPLSMDLDQLPLSDVDYSLKALGMYSYTTDLQEIKAKLRDVLLENFHAMLAGANLAGTEFPEPFDVCMAGTWPGVEYRKTFLDVSIPIPLGPVVLQLSFGVGGGVGISLAAEVCIISMKVTGWARPYAGIEAYAGVGISFGPLKAGLRLTARILETTLPAFVTVTFSNFPLKVCFGVDWVTVPLSLRLEGYVQLRICVWKCWTKTLIRATLYRWSSPGALHVHQLHLCFVC